MKTVQIALGLALAVLLSACAAKPIPAAPSAANVTAPTPNELTSSIRGTREKGLLGSSGCFVAGIDGKMIPQAPRVYETPIPIGPGVHSLLIGNSTNRYTTLPARLDAKSSVKHVIRCESKTDTALFPDETYMWIENEITKEAVAQKRKIVRSLKPVFKFGFSEPLLSFEPPEKNSYNLYKEPQAPAETLAVIRSASEETTTTSSNAFVAAVDGYEVVNSAKNLTRSFKIKAGQRALLLAAYTGRAFTEYPVILDVEARHLYVVRFILDSGVVPGLTNERFTVWIDDETTGVRVTPAQRVKLKKVPSFNTPIPTVTSVK